MADTVRAHVYFRRKGERAYRDLGTREMNNVPPAGGQETIDIDGKSVEARVVKVDKFVAHKHRPAPEPNIWIEAI